MTECNQNTFAFTAHFSRRVEAEFTAGQVSTDGGALMLREVGRRIDLLGRLHSRIDDKAINLSSSLCGPMKHLPMQIAGHPHDGALRRELNAILARITSTLPTVISYNEDSE